MPKVYRVKDNQITGRYFNDGEIKTKEMVIEDLTDFHDIDFEGEKDDGTPYKDMAEFIASLKDDEERLDFILNHGDWSLEEVSDREVLEWCADLLCRHDEFIEANDTEYYSKSQNVAEAGRFFKVADELEIKYN
jgi:hypothetical protein